MNEQTNTLPQKKIVIFGGTDCREGDELFCAAEALGEAFARRGWAVVNGGYGGTMLASARGAARCGGSVIGVVCCVFNSPPNEFVGQVVPTANLFERLRQLIEFGDAYLVLPGSTGTLAELATVWELVNKRMIPRRPILCWGDYWRPIVHIFDQDSTRDPRIDTNGLPDRRVELIQFVSSSDEVLAILDQALPA